MSPIIAVLVKHVVMIKFTIVSCSIEHIVTIMCDFSFIDVIIFFCRTFIGVVSFCSTGITGDVVFVFGFLGIALIYHRCTIFGSSTIIKKTDTVTCTSIVP